MIRTGTVFLLYHELQLPGRESCQNEPVYRRYVVGEANFREQVTFLRTSGGRGMSVTAALEGPATGRPGIVITFDDGCETDLIAAAAMLKDAGFGATFYIVAGFLGRRGYLTEAQLRELSSAGFEIGCHSMTHCHLTDLDPVRLRVELEDSKRRLEEVIGRRIDHLSCPKGRWNRRVARAAQEAGYRSVATSRIGTNSPTADPFCLARVAVLRGTFLADFDRICEGKGFLLRQASLSILSLAKSLLGNARYEKARSAVLGRG